MDGCKRLDCKITKKWLNAKNEGEFQDLCLNKSSEVLIDTLSTDSVSLGCPQYQLRLYWLPRAQNNESRSQKPAEFSSYPQRIYKQPFRKHWVKKPM